MQKISIPLPYIKAMAKSMTPRTNLENPRNGLIVLPKQAEVAFRNHFVFVMPLLTPRLDANPFIIPLDVIKKIGGCSVAKKDLMAGDLYVTITYTPQKVEGEPVPYIIEYLGYTIHGVARGLHHAEIVGIQSILDMTPQTVCRVIPSPDVETLVHVERMLKVLVDTWWFMTTKNDMYYLVLAGHDPLKYRVYVQPKFDVVPITVSGFWQKTGVNFCYRYKL